jgi:hypothetical protein
LRGSRHVRLDLFVGRASVARRATTRPLSWQVDDRRVTAHRPATDARAAALSLRPISTTQWASVRLVVPGCFWWSRVRYVLGLGPGDRIRPRTQPADADGGAGVAAASVVPAPMFEAMRLLLGARTPIVLLLRDPVARYRSAGWWCHVCAHGASLASRYRSAGWVCHVCAWRVVERSVDPAAAWSSHA